MASKGYSIGELILKSKTVENEQWIPTLCVDLYPLLMSRRGLSISALPHEHCSGRVVGTSEIVPPEGPSHNTKLNGTMSVTKFHGPGRSTYRSQYDSQIKVDSGSVYMNQTHDKCVVRMHGRAFCESHAAKITDMQENNDNI